ncbi:hypothetical protein COJ46_21910 [Bacillus sp. AFS077874]|uniref:hypothetical protein n=1 Tax=unclassified Bacillus (in: firmicutes) TaxID=185979 RepID=UPI000BF6F2D4|nr:MULTISPECIES: hypothetical protein [unclassified Bacillus (in: firmicutes)]PET71576.1 hypothetical protein CN514_06605 [Bacillus sp. AFS001701]PFM75321.1 hypothetical protein COJ46_21910 [Bacillus sp. AFS077874]
MRKIKNAIFSLLTVATLAVSIPQQAAAAGMTWQGYDFLSLSFGIWNISQTYYLGTGTIQVCISGVDNGSNTYTLQAYEDDGASGLTLLANKSLTGNTCINIYGATADGDNGYAEFYFRVGTPRYSDSSIRADVYQ